MVDRLRVGEVVDGMRRYRSRLDEPVVRVPLRVFVARLPVERVPMARGAAGEELPVRTRTEERLEPELERVPGLTRGR